MMEKLFEMCDSSILKRSEITKSLNLEDGKLGFCIYLYRMAELKRSPQYKLYAERLFSQVCSDLSTFFNVNPIYDLAQMGIAIDYLVKNEYVKGDVNDLLSDFDEVLFSKLANGEYRHLQSNEVILILYYLCIRLEKQKQKSNECFMLEELCIVILNELCEKVNCHFFEEPLRFTLEYKLPLFVYVLAKIYSLNFYNNRLYEFIKMISGLITSNLPVLHSNRLYLLWALVHLKRSVGLDLWDEQIDILCKYIDINEIMGSEFRNKDISFRNGLSFIYFLLCGLKGTSYEILYDKNIIKQKIENSEIWKDERWLSTGLGLINGISGAILVYFLIGQEK